MYLKNGLGRYLADENNENQEQLGGFWDRVRDEIRDVYEDWRNRRPPSTRPPSSPPGTGTGIPTEAWYAIAAVAVIALWPKR